MQDRIHKTDEEPDAWHQSQNSARSRASESGETELQGIFPLYNNAYMLFCCVWRHAYEDHSASGRSVWVCVEMDWWCVQGDLQTSGSFDGLWADGIGAR